MPARRGGADAGERQPAPGARRRQPLGEQVGGHLVEALTAAGGLGFQRSG
jgi:hypothetical protein